MLARDMEHAVLDSKDVVRVLVFTEIPQEGVKRAKVVSLEQMGDGRLVFVRHAARQNRCKGEQNKNMPDGCSKSSIHRWE